MIEHKILDPQKSFHYFIKLASDNIKSDKNFSGFKSFNEKLYQSDFKILHDHFECRNIIFFNAEGSALAACTHYKPKNQLLIKNYPESIGNFLFSDLITDEQLKDCGTALQKLLTGSKAVLPLNGSFNLGIYHNPNADQKTSFLTTAYNSQIDRFFKLNTDIFLKHRTSHALNLDLNVDTRQKLKNELGKIQSDQSFSTRPFKRIGFLKDFRIYNQLVNESMSEHFLFFSIQWKAMKQLILPLVLFIVPKYFRFILKDKTEIGFVMATPDYNELLTDSKSDFMNFLSCVFSRHKIKTARIIYSCLLPKYQGKKLIKTARHQVLIDLFNDGFAAVESSYIDENNQKSIGNVRSTGAKLKQDYFLYRID